MKPIDAIQTERRRQVEVEGWSEAHDAAHEPGHLLRAGVLYLWHGTDKAAPIETNGAPLSWPWEPRWWKPRARRANLVRAGALMMAERDAILTRHRARIHQERERYARKGLEVRRFSPGPPSTEHVEHKLQIVLREIAALDAAKGSVEACLSGFHP